MYDESTMKPLVSNMHSSLLFPQETQACAMCLILATGPDQQVRKSCGHDLVKIWGGLG